MHDRFDLARPARPTRRGQCRGPLAAGWAGHCCIRWQSLGWAGFRGSGIVHCGPDLRIRAGHWSRNGFDAPVLALRWDWRWTRRERMKRPAGRSLNPARRRILFAGSQGCRPTRSGRADSGSDFLGALLCRPAASSRPRVSGRSRRTYLLFSLRFNPARSLFSHCVRQAGNRAGADGCRCIRAERIHIEINGQIGDEIGRKRSRQPGGVRHRYCETRQKRRRRHTPHRCNRRRRRRSAGGSFRFCALTQGGVLRFAHRFSRS